ncbi:NYN domain-containing protein [Micrococcus flavus]|uniref:NYN domain-containing protein n=1 Tax=Micrococcus flavus TaxID=384602 RepID=A0A4Y8WV28_9MICC|nr:NYN domain-containing protein [Micrococcus flavus]MBB4883750.1 uncharacterized protein [Micrococcus flavus]TFH98912.1 NYN domain-containing protein [Micrococcus flavus]GGK47886.1 nuclease [Micrococcus flavus]
MSVRQTYLLVDGENIDATLGMSVLNRRPHPEERPRWQRVLAHVERAWGQPVRPLFFLAVEGEIPFGFVQALTTMGYQPILLKGSGKVVDIGIQRTAEALLNREADVVLASHDVDFAPHMQALAAEGSRVAVMGFEEFMSAELRAVNGMEVWDLEHEVAAFDAPLPRLRVIPIDEFDPFDFL